MKRELILIALLLNGLLLCGCRYRPVDCKTVKISIDNRGNDENGGLNELELKDSADIQFICHSINNFPKGEMISPNYNYGVLDIYLNNQDISMIFSFDYGVVYQISPSRFVTDEQLTKRILEIMKIKNRRW